jgi:ribosomal protein S3
MNELDGPNIFILYFKLYTPEEFNNFLSEAGFSNIEIHENPEKCWITIIGTKKTSE